MDERVVRAGELFERAIFGGAAEALDEADRELDAVEADLALARGKVLHGRFLAGGQEDPAELELFERALGLARELGDEGRQAEAFFWIGCFHQVVREDTEPATSALERSRALATASGADLTLSYALRHLGIAAHQAGELEEAQSLLEESTRIRRILGFTAGVAANLVGLVHLALAQDRPEDARALADEATALAEACGADKVLEQLAEARTRF